MSGICGIFHSEGSPIDRELLIRMRDIVAHRGPDRSGLWLSGRVGLGHRLLWNSEESVREQQPMTNGRGLWLTADCRIDNREELREEFQARGIWQAFVKQNGGTALPDCAYILMAYEQWGREAPHHLLGDFAFGLWDERRQAFFCVREPIGIKPFVYHWDGRRFLFGSEIKQIFQDPAVPQDLNLDYLTEFIILITNRQETPYRAVRRLPPGHALWVQAGKIGLSRYWRWDPDGVPKSAASLEENALILRDLLQRSVADRLRVPPAYRAGSLLSGGLDSSSMVSLAAPLWRGRRGESLPVFTLHFPEADPAYLIKNSDPVDESAYSQAVIQQHQLEAHPIVIQGWGPLQNLEKLLWHQEGPLFFQTLGFFTHLFEEARDCGVRALLHGEGGDELFAVGAHCFPLEWIRGHLRRCYRQFFPRQLPDWIEPVWARRIGLARRATGDFYRDGARCAGSSSYGIQSWIQWGPICSYFDMIDRGISSAGLEIRLPFADLRLWRFCAALPWNQKQKGSVTKVLLREALKERLPPLVRDRSRKADFRAVAFGLLERYAAAAIQGVLESPHPVLRSVIIPSRVKALYTEQILAGGSSSTRSSQAFHFFWYLVSLDQWLKHLPVYGKNKLKEGGRYEERESSVAEKKG